MPKTLSAGDRHKLRLIYDMAERRFQDALPPEHYMEAADHSFQREITLGSLAVLRQWRADFHLFNEMLVLYQIGRNEFETAGVVPDNFVVLHDGPLEVDNSYRMPLQPVGPFLVMEYVSTHNKRKDYDDNMTRYQDALRVPYYLLFHPGSQELTLYKMRGRRYRAVRPDADGRVAVPELDLVAGVFDGWMRYWYRGELLALPAELMDQLTAAKRRAATAERRAVAAEREATAAEQRLAAEQAARQALEAEIARLKAELAAKG